MTGVVYDQTSINLFGQIDQSVTDGIEDFLVPGDPLGRTVGYCFPFDEFCELTAEGELVPAQRMYRDHMGNLATEKQLRAYRGNVNTLDAAGGRRLRPQGQLLVSERSKGPGTPVPGRAPARNL